MPKQIAPGHSGSPTPPPDPLGTGEFEPGATVKDLVFFQERKERLASALSILGSILTPENRPFVLTKLRLGTSAVPRTATAAPSAQRGQSWIGPAALIGGILCGAAGLLFLLDAEHPNKSTAWVLIGAAVILGIAAFAVLRRGKNSRGTADGAPGNPGPTAEATPSEPARLAVAFTETVKPLATELSMTIHLDDLEGLLDQLKTYEEYGRDLEDFHVAK